MGWREHQHELHQFMQAPECGTQKRLIIADVTPSGGKSAFSPIIAHFGINRGLFEKLCVVVPRNTLRTQTEKAFSTKWIRDLLGHKLEIRAAENEVNPDRGTAGYVTTYQAIEANPGLHLDFFRRYRTAVEFDEAHHLLYGDSWHRAVEPLFELAALRVMKSGTYGRHDLNRIAFLQYQPLIKGRAKVLLDNTRDQQVIRYSWRDALSEHAIIPLQFHYQDGNAKWRDSRGDQKEVKSLTSAGEDTRSAIWTALNESYARELLAAAVAHFQGTRLRNPRAKFLCIAPSIGLAKRYLAEIKRLGLAACDIATSEDSSRALFNIDRLKGLEKPYLDALVTVQMAYEGMDCPPITHVALLTHIRSKPWIDQAISRAIRYDETAGAWREQQAHIFAPDDELLLEIVKEIHEAQAPFMEETNGNGGGGGGDRGGPIVPMAAAATKMRGFDFSTGDEAGSDEYELLQRLANEHGIYGVSPVQLKRVFNEFQDERFGFPAPDDPLPDYPAPSQRIAQLQKWIQRHLVAYAKDDYETKMPELYGRIEDRYGTKVTAMTEAQLNQVWEELRYWMPLS